MSELLLIVLSCLYILVAFGIISDASMHKLTTKESLYWLGVAILWPVLLVVVITYMLFWAMWSEDKS